MNTLILIHLFCSFFVYFITLWTFFYRSYSLWPAFCSFFAYFIALCTIFYCSISFRAVFCSFFAYFIAPCTFFCRSHSFWTVFCSFFAYFITPCTITSIKMYPIEWTHKNKVYTSKMKLWKTLLIKTYLKNQCSSFISSIPQQLINSMFQEVSIYIFWY